MKMARQGAKARNKEQNPAEIASPGKPDSYPVHNERRSCNHQRQKKTLFALVFVTNPSGGHRKATTPPLFGLISIVPHHRFILRFLFTEPDS